MSTVSVIIPTYNCGEWIARAISSVLDETQPQVEVIVIDDGSCDNTRDVVAPWISSGVVKYIFQQNGGLPGARNAGARIARGEYLAFLDADDALAPGAIRCMWAATEASDASWCLVDIVRMSQSDSEVQRTVVPDQDPFYSILEYNFVRRGMFFRKAALFAAGLYDPAIRMCEDWELNIRMFEQRRPFVYISKPLYLYTKREGSITTGRIAENLSYTEQVFRKHHKRLADQGDKLVAHLYAFHMWDLARRYWYSVHMPAASVRCMCESLKYEFNGHRLVHPVVHFAGKVFRRLQGPAPRQSS